MRNPDRLDGFYKSFKKLHKACFPDLRFGQLMSNFFGWIFSEKQVDFFFTEEGKMLEYFYEYCKKYNSEALGKLKEEFTDN